jgi:transposase
MNIGCPVIGVDVAKDFCFYAALSPSGKRYLKSFKAFNSKAGLEFVLEQIKKVEDAFDSKPVIVLESTGHYSQRTVHFFIRNDCKVFLVNPLISHSIKTSTIRKVKTDKVDAEELAKLFFLQELRETKIPNEYFINLKALSRANFHLLEQKVSMLNQLVAAVEQVMPLFPKIFDTLASKTALALLIQYSSPDALASATREEVVDFIQAHSKMGSAYAHKKYELLLQCIEDAKMTGILMDGYYKIIRIYAENVKHINEQLKVIDKEIEELAFSLQELSLLESIPGIGKKIAPIIASEIGDISRFDSAKQLVAYCGIDPSVRQSGNFTGSNNKLTKRGSSYVRRALYLAATVAIRKQSKGTFVNQVLHDYYQGKIQFKAKKQVLGAIMNKLVRIIFSVLKNKQQFTLITPQEQIEKYRSHIKKAA